MKQQQNKILFLPTNDTEMRNRGWDELDVLFISGDAYIDHPAFGTALLARLLESKGFRVGILAQPDWKDPATFRTMGRPRLFAAISAGAMDSMVNHYTAAKKIRRNDAYTPGGIAGKRPNRAIIAYTAAVKGAFKGLPTVIGGIEASLRRFAHYDYWSDKVRRSILIDSKADLLIYGMAETALLEITRCLDKGASLETLRKIKGTAFTIKTSLDDAIKLPSYEQVSESTEEYNQAFKLASEQENPFSAKVLMQPHGNQNLIINPPALPLSEKELDQAYDLPFVRQPHPNYTEKIPAFEQIQHSITSHRGCFGGCAFCAITHHQGKTIQSRSAESILQEIDKISSQDDFHGTISDVGGPTANMYGLGCGNPKAEKICQRPSCLYPDICKNLITDDQPATRLLEKIRQHKKIKHIFIASGIRYDLLPGQQQYFSDLLQYHVSGLLKVAPESTSDRVTKVMRKPAAAIFTRFLDQFRQYNRKFGLHQAVVPYLISNHPGSTLEDMIEVALYLKRHQLKVEQVQDFTPTPGSLSTCIFHTGRDPFSGKKIHIPRGAKERRLQKSLLLYHQPETRADILEALKLCRREDVAQKLFGSQQSMHTIRKPQKRQKQDRTKGRTKGRTKKPNT
ncbi:MAG: YgiQ family radical SAM protein [Thermodesulfobacteriota bacterium]|nr:YgiQ family radical SAM protein [Thermodesulfobacteriota bacterium]